MRSRKFKLEEKLDELADLLLSEPRLQEPTHREFANYLNARRFPPRRMRKMAMERIREWEETEKWLHEDEEWPEPERKAGGDGGGGASDCASHPVKKRPVSSLLRAVRQVLVLPLERVLGVLVPRRGKIEQG
ncbi:MAG: hypothetical protein D6811_05555 [Alphaproteobacteria bacterium]|nr:MAG: hypothetical protein D6811_05555 [Alphaproteobacteria bacterium]